MVAERAALPWNDTWNADAAIRIRAKDPPLVEALAKGAAARLSSGDGHQLDVRLTDVHLVGHDVVARIHADRIPSAGEYAGKLSLDPLDAKAASVDLTVKARHPWLWPLIVLFAGVGLGVGGTALYEARRRQMVLQSALIEAGVWMRGTPTTERLYDVPDELIGRDGAGLGSGRCRDQTKPLPKQYCAVRKAWADIDEHAKAVLVIRDRSELWYAAAGAVGRSRVALARLDDAARAIPESQTEALLGQIADHLDLKDRAVVEKLDAQAAVAAALAATWEAWVAANRPPGLDPLEVYGRFNEAHERETDDSSRLVGQLRELQLRIQARQSTAMVGLAPAFGGDRRLPAILLSPPPTSAELRPPPWLPGAPAVADAGLLRAVRAFDLVVFLAHLTVAGVAFLLPIYAATNFGTIDQYLLMFAAGFLGKVALDQAVGLVRSVRLLPARDAPK